MVSWALKGAKHQFGRTTTCKLPLTVDNPNTISMPLIPTPLTMTSYSLLSFSLSSKIYFALVNSAGLTKLPYTAGY